MNIGTVVGGSNAGWRRTKPQPSDWTCPKCRKKLKRFWTKCPVDSTLRPEEV